MLLLPIAASAATTRGPLADLQWSTLNNAIHGNNTTSDNRATAGNGCGTLASPSTCTGPLNNGDTVILPAGTGNWAATEQLYIAKCIMLDGAGSGSGGTAINTAYNGTSPVGIAVEKKGAVHWNMSASPFNGPGNFLWGMKDVRITSTGTGANLQALFKLNGYSAWNASPTPYIIGQTANFYMSNVVGISNVEAFEWDDVIGLVALSEFSVVKTTAHPNNEQWSGDPANPGPFGAVTENFFRAHGSFSEPVDWASDKFMYFEDCVFHGSFDAYHGGRYAIRHSTFDKGAAKNHGSESGSARGGRAIVTSNNWHYNQSGSLGEFRSGGLYGWDNISEGTGTLTFYQLQNHRNHLQKDYGTVDGTNPQYHRATTNFGPTVDQNTLLYPNPSGTPSAGNYPDDGNTSADVVTGTSNGVFPPCSPIPCGTQNVFTANGTPFTVDQFKTVNLADNSANSGYVFVLVNTRTSGIPGTQLGASTIRNVADPASANYNHSNSTSVIYNAFVERGGAGNDAQLEFANGDPFAIRRVYFCVDQPGAGRSDRVHGNVVNPNTNTAQPSGHGYGSGGGGKMVGFLNQQRDPSRQWENYIGTAGAFGSGGALNFFTEQGMLVLGRDFYNSKPAGFPTSNNQDQNARTIGARGVAGYTPWGGGTGTKLATTAYGMEYPHWMRGGVQPTPTPSVTPSPTASPSPSPRVTGPSNATYATDSTNNPVQTFTATNFTGTPTWTYTPSNSLPSGVNFAGGSGNTTTISGNPLAGTAGNYSVTVTATYAPPSPDETDGIPFTLVVTATNSAPIVSLTNPPTGTPHYDAPAAIPLGATASDSTGSVDHVTWYRDDGITAVGSDSTAPYSATWNNVSQGTYTIKADAVDSFGLRSSLTTGRTVVVDAPITAPAPPAYIQVHP